MDKMSNRGNPAVAQEMTKKVTEESKKPTISTAGTVDADIKTVSSRLMDADDNVYQKDSFYRKDQNTISRIKALELKPAPKITAKTTCPDEFLRAIDAEQMPENLFTEDDIQQIYQMIEKHPSCLEVSFYSLFGMEIFSLASKLNNLKSGICKSGINKFLDEIRSVYIHFCSCIQTSDEIDFRLFTDCNDGFKKSFDIFKDEEKSTLNKNKAQQLEAMREEYKLKIVPFIQEWDKAWNLLNKFIKHTQAEHLLCNVQVGTCLGARAIVQLSSIDDIQMARKDLNDFATYIIKFIDVLNLKPSECSEFSYDINPRISTRFSTMFEKIAKEIRTHKYDKQKNKQVEFQCEKLLKIISESIFDLNVYESESVTPRMKEIEEFSVEVVNGLQKPNAQQKKLLSNLPKDVMLIPCYDQWLKDLYKALFDSILPAINSSSKKLVAYEERAYLNLGKLNCEIQDEPYLQNCEFVSPQWYKDIYTKFYSKLSEIYNYLQGIMDTHVDCSSIEIRTLYVINTKIKLYHEKLKSIAESTLNELFAYAQAHKDEVSKLPLIDMTVRLGQTLIIVHDLDMVINGTCQWNFIFPKKYIDFISIESDTETESTGDAEELFFAQEILGKEGFSSIFASEDFREKEVTAENLDSDFVRLRLSSTHEMKGESPKSSSSSQKALSSKVNHRSSKEFGRRKSKAVKAQPSALSSSSSSVSSTQVAANDSLTDELDLNVTKRRKIKKLLRKLGAIFNEGGNHTRMSLPQENGNLRLATVIPRHGRDLGLGLRRAMRNQILNNTENKT